MVVGAIMAGAALRCEARADDRMAAPATVAAGDVARGRAIVQDRRRGFCGLCHGLPGERFPGNIGPALEDVGARLDADQLRLRLVDPARINGQTVMPAYFRSEGLHRVGARWQGQSILNAQEIEDVIAYLLTLRG